MRLFLYGLLTVGGLIGTVAVAIYYLGARGKRKEHLEHPKYQVLDDDDKDEF
jgi:hypothetical protein